MATPSLNTNCTASSETLPNSPFHHGEHCQSGSCHYRHRSATDTSKDEADNHCLTGTTATTSTSETLTNNNTDDPPGLNQLRPAGAYSLDEDGIAAASYHAASEEYTPRLDKEQDLEQAMVEVALHTTVSELINYVISQEFPLPKLYIENQTH